MPTTRAQARAQGQRQAPRGWADAPPDLLRACFRTADELPKIGKVIDLWGNTEAVEQGLLLADLRSAASVCRSWRRALSARPTVGSLSIGGGSRPGKREWMQRVRLGAVRLRIHCSAWQAAGQEMLGLLNGAATEEAEIGLAPHCLPDPALLPNLRRLSVTASDPDITWLPRLGQLTGLSELELGLGQIGPPRRMTARGEEREAGQPALPFLPLPAMPALRRLKVFLEPGAPLLMLDVSVLPDLEEAEVWGGQWESPLDRGAVQVTAGAPAEGGAAGSEGPAAAASGQPSRLRKLSLDISRIWADFGALPALESAQLWSITMGGGDSLARAGRLSDLLLGEHSCQRGGFMEHDLDVAHMLCALPPALCTLRLRGSFLPQPAADALAAVGTLRLLWFDDSIQDGMTKDDFVPPREAREQYRFEIPPGPLWSSLRLLSWESWQRLPKALASADQLELLCWGLNQAAPTEQEIDLLASLPRLRRLRVACHEPPDRLRIRLHCACAKPCLQEVAAGDWRGFEESEATFWREAAALVDHDAGQGPA